MTERYPWGDFPPVERNSDLGALKACPEYAAAKAGNAEAALQLAVRLITDDFLSRIRDRIGTKAPSVVPVLALEMSGRNKIPLAAACVIASRLGLRVEDEIAMINTVFRTNSGADHRLVSTPAFTGPVEPGGEYILVDDTLSMGGTLAALRGFIENRCGKVLLATAITAHEGACQLPPTQKMLDAIARKHGPAMNDLCQEVLGYGLQELTQGEAGHFRAVGSVAAMRDRLFAARDEARLRLDAETASQPGSEALIRSSVEGPRQSARETLKDVIDQISSMSSAGSTQLKGFSPR